MLYLFMKIREVAKLRPEYWKGEKYIRYILRKILEAFRAGGNLVFNNHLFNSYGYSSSENLWEIGI